MNKKEKSQIRDVKEMIFLQTAIIYIGIALVMLTTLIAVHLIKG